MSKHSRKSKNCMLTSDVIMAYFDRTKETEVITHRNICGPLPTGEYLFVVIDAYSCFLQGQNFCYLWDPKSVTK